MKYEEFIARKSLVNVPTGLSEIPPLNPMLYDFQSALVGWALRRGRAALFCDCGLGKTPMQLEWARHIPGNVLILAPLAVSMQTVAEGRKFGVDVNYRRDQIEATEGITITNYEMLDHFDPSYFTGIVLDECFPPETPIDVFSIDNVLTCKYIKDVRKGDRIYNATGGDIVQSIYKRRINRAVKIGVNGHRITCSENHPFFTMHGWRSAQDLRPGDYIMATSEAVRLVRDGVQTTSSSTENAEVLRSILLSEMAHEHTRTQSQGPYGSGSHEAGDFPFHVVEEWQPKGRSGAIEDSRIKPNEQSRDKSEAVIDIAEDGAQTFRAWGQWSSDDITAATDDGCVVRQLDSGICYITGETSTRFSNMLQGRLRESRLENSDRTGRPHPPEPQGKGQEEGHKTGFFRVDSVEILELGHPDLERYRDENGDVYFYDIKATRHPSFSVGGCLVHNSSILKSFTGKTRNSIIESFQNTPFRLACSATPAPNDYMELGNHSEFLGVMNRTEMLAMYFIHDGGETSKWRLKGHAEDPYWKWVCTWAMNVRKPSDLGFEDRQFIIPPMDIHSHTVKVNEAPEGFLFPVEALTLQERQYERRSTTAIRAKECADIVATHPDKQWLIWCNLNDESALLTSLIPGAVEVKGADSMEHKEKALLGFATGEVKILVSKPKIAGMGLNYQSCHKMAFVGLSDSYEQFYQAVRRCWRFGQQNPVDVHVITAETEGAVVRNIQRKEADAMRMADNMLEHMRTIEMENIAPQQTSRLEYTEDVVKTDNYQIWNGDCVQLAKRVLEDESIDFSVFSPPYLSLFTYSSSDLDMGNAKSDEEFYEHFSYLLPELYRAMKPGRNVAVDCMNVPAMKERDGYIGLKDFRGELIRLFKDAGFIFHSEHCMWKDPLIEATRTKALGLMHKQLCKDSTMSRAGIPQYLLCFRKPGVNSVPVTHENGLDYFAGEDEPSTGNNLSHERWRRYASPVWMDINFNRTLNYKAARESNDERHICPMSLDITERAIWLWSNPGETVLTTYAGVGSEMYQALQMDRKAIGFELKRSYWHQAVANCKEADATTAKQASLFG